MNGMGRQSRGSARWAVSAVLVAALLWNAGDAGADGAARSVQTVAEGTRFATPLYVQDSGVEGPVVMVVGGIHGNEPAGAEAADQIRRWPIVRGRLVVLPRANLPALAAGTRSTPDEPDPLRDLNRNFPKADEPDSPAGEPAAAVWLAVLRHRPDWLIDLHEGHDFRRSNSNSFGNSIIVHPTPEARAAAGLLLEAVNAAVAKEDEEEKGFVPLGPPVNGSLSRAAGEHLGAHTMILETTHKSQRLPLRTRQHRIMVHRLLSHLEMLDEGVTVEWLTDRGVRGTRPAEAGTTSKSRDRAAVGAARPADAGTPTVWVALYDGGGSAGRGVPRVIEQAAPSDHVEVICVAPEDIRGGALQQFDLVVFTGGSGSGQARALGAAGREEVRQFVEDGGGYIGICAGSYLACAGFSWGVSVLDAKTVSSRWRRGSAMVEMELTERGREVFGDLRGPIPVRYANGPIIEPLGSEGASDYEPLALFRTEVAKNDTPEGVMIGSPAIVAARYGAGRVLWISPHPEQTEGLETFVPRAVEWAARRKR